MNPDRLQKSVGVVLLFDGLEFNEIKITLCFLRFLHLRTS